MASIMVSPAHRRPFAEIGSARMGQLSAMKNTQNAITSAIFQDAGKLDMKQSQFTFSSPAKRPLQASSVFDQDNSEVDRENIDPAAASSKRSKGLDGSVSKKPTYHLQVTPSPAMLSDKSTLQTSYTAPAGRSPKHKRVGILSRNRLSGPNFRAILPPTFGSRKTSNGSFGFSIDAALNGTLAKRSPNVEAQDTLVSAQPKAWFFAIHEDTAEEEAGILMEHSCLTLDISSDDEAGPSKKDLLDKGKENIPPEDHQASQHNRSGATLPSKLRSSAGPDAMTEEDRSPLGSLAASDFYSEGLDATSVVVVVESDDRDEQADNVSNQQPDVVPEEQSVPQAESIVDTEPRVADEMTGQSDELAQPQEVPMIVIAEDATASEPQ